MKMRNVSLKLVLILLIMSFVLFITGCKKFVLEISGENTVEVGETIKLTTNYEGNERISWNSSNQNIATVYNGVVTPISEGTVEITAKVEKYTALFTVTVEINYFDVKIIGNDSTKVGETYKYKIETSIETSYPVIWSVSDEEFATINEYGTFTAKKAGQVVLIAQVGKNVVEKIITISEKQMPEIIFTPPHEMEIGEETRITVGIRNPDLITGLGIVDFEVSENGIVSLRGVPTSDWFIKALSPGTVTIRVFYRKAPHIFTEKTVTVLDNNPKATRIDVSGDFEMNAGEFNQLNATVYDLEFDQSVTWSSSDETVAIIEDGLVLGLKEGTSLITVASVVEPSVKTTFVLTVNKHTSNGYTEEQINRVNQIIANMTLSQKVGQMFAIGFSGTSYSSTLDSVIKNYNFGNVIYMGANVTNPSTLASMSNAIQNAMINANGVPAFITIDQEGGRVVRLSNGGTHFISNMAILATNDPNNTYLQGLAVGAELRNYGINVDFAPVLDVNNNPENPVIGARSYGENPFLVAKYGIGLIKGLQESNVVATAKHFPGHGNTSVDSHSGLPVITSSKEDLYKIELAPFISAIGSGIDAIMTTHIIFTAIDSEFPATLSNKVLTGLLREELGYDGVIITDGMEMGALQSNFGNAGELAVKAVKAGVDILLYTSNTTPRTAHSAIMSAVNSGQISEERINESVRRILLKKLTNGILDDYQAPNNDISDLLKKNENLNNTFAIQSLTQVKGSFNGFEEGASILIVSPTCNYTIEDGIVNNSLGCYAAKYLAQNGYITNYYTINENATSAQINAVMNQATNYDYVVIATSNVKTKNYTNTASLVKQLLEIKSNTIVIALDTPYDYLCYNNRLNNYICVYGYQKASVLAITKYLNSEFDAQGVAPFDFKE